MKINEILLIWLCTESNQSAKWPTHHSTNGRWKPKYPVVTDGVVQVEVLESIGRSEEWLLDNLSKQGHDNVANIFIAEYDKGAVTVVTYE